MAIIDLEGVEEFFKKLDGAGERLIAAGAAALYQNGGNILSRSNEMCPVDTGSLRRSGYETLPELGDDLKPIVEIGYGGIASQYAEKVHEDLSVNHKVGEAKFLEKAINEAKSTWSDDIGELTKRNFERGASWPSKGSQPSDPWSDSVGVTRKVAKRVARASTRKGSK